MSDVHDVFELGNGPEPLPSRRSRRAKHGRRPASAGSIIVGFLGELLITAGVIVGLFVVWQVFWTDVIGARDMDTHLQQFQEGLSDVPDEIAEKRRGDEPVAEVEMGDIGALYVPRWGDDYQVPIAEGVGLDLLNDGYVGHYPDTELPGETGNVAIAGHRQSYGKPFRHVEDLEDDDPIIVETADAFYVYRIIADEIVDPTETRVISSNPFEPEEEADQQLLTLTTCHPLWSIKERWIVHAELDYWVDRDEGRPADLPGGTE